MNAILNQAMRCLLSQIADTLQMLHVDSTRTAYVWADCETMRFPVNWPSLLLNMQCTLFKTAYSHCCMWQQGDPKDDMKQKSDNLPSESGRLVGQSTPHPPLQISVLCHGSAAQTSNSSSKKCKCRKHR